MIVRDEEEFLARCLASVEGLADQIVVVDTGSTDRTVEIAEAHGAEVHHFAWSDDFGAARNESLRHARGDWVLVLDADEWLDPGSHDEIRRLIESTEHVGYTLRTLNYADDGEASSIVEHPNLRLFPGDPDLRYVGRDPHAQLLPTRADMGLRVERSQAIIHHDGYRPRVFEARGKAERNRLLLERAVREQPGEPFHAYNLGVTYNVLGRPADAETQLLRAIALLPGRPGHGTVPDYLANAYVSLALAVFRQERYAEAAAYCERALELEPNLPDAYVTFAAAHVRLGDLDRALRAYEQALATGPQETAAASDRAAASWKALLGIGEVQLLRNRPADALPALEQACALSGGDPSALLGLGHALRSLGRSAEAGRRLEQAVAADRCPPEAWVLLAELRAEEGRVEDAEAALREALRRRPDDAVSRARLADLRRG